MSAVFVIAGVVFLVVVVMGLVTDDYPEDPGEDDFDVK